MFHIDTRTFMTDATEPVRFEVDGHWNSEGHRRVALALEHGLEAFLANKSPENEVD